MVEITKWAECRICESRYCSHSGEARFIAACSGYTVPKKPKTNAERIREMSDEELCEMLTIGTGGFDCGTCRDSNECDRECEWHCAEWLKTTCRGR